MLNKNLSELSFNKLQKYYGNVVSYTWEIEGVRIKFNTTGQLASQRKVRELILEKIGISVNRISPEEWSLILNTAFAAMNTAPEEEIEEFWLLKVAEYCAYHRSDEQRDIAEGKVYQTNTGWIFTTVGLVNYLNKFPELSACSPTWHSNKLRNDLNAKITSHTLNNFKGRAAKVNSYSCRVHQTFLKHYEALMKHEETA